MQVKCDYCGSYIDEQLETCPNCGAPNDHIKRAATGVPRTIKELQEFCSKNNVPLDKFHFHIGENYEGPQAIGIYYDEVKKEYVVYKNKTDGTRAIRYHGHDEGYAVNEVYQKLKEQIGDYKAYRASKGAIHTGNNKQPAEDPRSKRIQMITWAVIIIIVLITVASSMSGKSSSNGSFYKYNGHSYYYDNGSWYSYNNNTGEYNQTYDVPQELENHRDDYYDNVNEYNEKTIDSDWDDDSSFDWSWGSSDDSSWDSGWDSGGSWDSDW